MDSTSKRTLRLGLVIDGTDKFIRPIEPLLKRNFTLTRFQPKLVKKPILGHLVNRSYLDYQLSRFMQGNDVVFFEWAASLLVRATRLSPHATVIARLHSVELATAVEHVNWDAVDNVVVMSEAIQDRLVRLVNANVPSVCIIRNGIDLNKFNYISKPFEFRLGMVCNVLPIKRVYELVLCLYQLRLSGAPFTLRIAGEEPAGEARRYMWAIEELIQRLELAPYVLFDGYVQDVAQWLQDIDVFISNSFWEGQQTALLEAMACGCYCLSHCWPGVSEILPQENIFITESELRSKLIRFSNLPTTEQERLKMDMRALVETKFDNVAVASEMIKVIKSLAEKQ